MGDKVGGKMVRKVAGAVPMREGSGGLEVLFVQSSKVKTRWLFPKGGTKKTEKRKQSAVSETWEESGVTGTLVSPPLGVWSLKNGTEEHKMWLLCCTDEASDYPEVNQRQKQWLTMPKANAMINEMKERGDSRAQSLEEMMTHAET